MSIPSTPGTPYLRNSQAFDSIKLPFATSYEEYDKFAYRLVNNNTDNGVFEHETSPESLSGSSIPYTPTKSLNSNEKTVGTDPKSFITHLESIKHLETRLNYRFLELDAKLRFLRLLTAGTGMSNEELILLDNENIQLDDKITKLQDKIEELKKIGKLLRKKISKCFHQTEIRRCIEGKAVLQSEIENLEEQIKQGRVFFQNNGLEDDIDNNDDKFKEDDNEWISRIVSENLIGFEMLENQLNKIQSEINEMNEVYEGFVETERKILKRDEEVNDEIVKLESEKNQLIEQLSNLQNNPVKDKDKEMLDSYNTMLQLVQFWSNI